MQVTLSASGYKQEAEQQLLEQATAAKKEFPEAAAAIMALRDDVRRRTHAASPDAYVTVAASIDVEVEIAEPKTGG